MRVTVDGKVRWWSLGTRTWVRFRAAEAMEEAYQEGIRVGKVPPGSVGKVASLIRNPVTGDYAVVDTGTGRIIGRVAEPVWLDEEDLSRLVEEKEGDTGGQQ